MWDLHRHVDPALVPPGRTVASFRFNDVPAKIGDWWLVMTADEVDLCDFDPRYEVAVSVTGPLRQMVGIWRGDLGGLRPSGRGRSSCRGRSGYGEQCRRGSRRLNLLRCVARRLILVLWPAK